MKISKKQLRAIIREARMGEYERDELATQIRHASKDIYGTKDHYDHRGKSVEELEDILYDLGNSPEQRYLDDEARTEMEDEMGYDSELSRAEMAPRRQGMRRRPGGSKAQRRMESVSQKEINQIVRSILSEKKMSNTTMRKTLRDAAAEIASDVPQQFNHDVMKIIDMVVATAKQKKTGDLKRIAQQTQRFSKKAMDMEAGDSQGKDDTMNSALKGGGSGEKEDKKDSDQGEKVVKFDA